MKLYKKELNRLCKVKWRDAFFRSGSSLEEMVKLEVFNTSVGWLSHFDKDYILVKSESSSEHGQDDYTKIPFDLVEEIEWVEE